MSDPRFRKVPAGRLSRAAVFGQLAGSVAGGVLAEGGRRLARGERLHMQDLLLTPASVGRVTEQLSRLRGAARADAGWADVCFWRASLHRGADRGRANSGAGLALSALV